MLSQAISKWELQTMVYPSHKEHFIVWLESNYELTSGDIIELSDKTRYELKIEVLDEDFLDVVLVHLKNLLNTQDIKCIRAESLIHMIDNENVIIHKIK